MEIGALFPQTEIGADRDDVRRYVTTVAELGLPHVLVYEHVLGADTSQRPGWRGTYGLAHAFHEPFVLFGFIAGIGAPLDLYTGVLVLPQRQTALVAKQAAEVDVLTGGRLRLGVGIGWNDVEYDALGQDFTTRGRRLEEQVELLRALWTKESVTFKGRWDTVDRAGIAPMPVQRPIPIWMGTGPTPVALRRAGRLADGWLPQLVPGPDLDAAWRTVREAAERAGRDPDAIALHGRVNVGHGDMAKVADHVGRWRDAGATHLSLNTMSAGLDGVGAHLEVLQRCTQALA